MKVAQWGDSLAVRLPEDVVKALGLKAGDDEQLKVSVVERPVFDAETQKLREEAIARMRAMARPLPEGGSSTGKRRIGTVRSDCAIPRYQYSGLCV